MQKQKTDEKNTDVQTYHVFIPSQWQYHGGQTSNTNHVYTVLRPNQKERKSPKRNRTTAPGIWSTKTRRRGGNTITGAATSLLRKTQ